MKVSMCFSVKIMLGRFEQANPHVAELNCGYCCNYYCNNGKFRLKMELECCGKVS